MSYVKTIWVNDETPVNADNMNNIENGIEQNELDISTLENNKLSKVSTTSTLDKIYVKQADGTQAMYDVIKQGSSAPTTSTVADFVGQMYLDTTSNKTYQCKVIDDSSSTTVYTWEEMNAVKEVESYTISSWSSLASSVPYTYSATIVATHVIGNNTTVELINDQAVLFATYGFAIGSINSQNITIYSIGQPSSNVTLKISYEE